MLPALVVDGVAHPLAHPLQAAALLGLEEGALPDPVAVGRDLERVLEAWLEAFALAPWPALLEATPSRGRASLELAVNTFVPVRLLPEAFASGRFDWPGNPTTGEPGERALREHELELEAALDGPGAFSAFAGPIAGAWSAFLAREEHALRERPARPVETTSGRLPYAGLLDAQRLHAAQHLRQATTFLRASGRPVPAFDPAALPGLRLPARVY